VNIIIFINSKPENATSVSSLVYEL
jgi:hypothetical protein